MAITTVLLDGGGVIVDETEFEQLYGEIIVEQLYQIVPGYSIESYYRDIEEAVRVFCPSVYKYVLWKYTKGSIPIFDTLYQKFLDLSKIRRPPMKMHQGFGTEAKMLSQKYKLVIAGQYGREVLSLLKDNKILDCFSSRITQDDFPITKPDPRYLEQIAQTIGSKPSECIMVGDRIDKDIIPARQLGMKTIRIKQGLHKNQMPREPFEIPDKEIDNVCELAKAVEDIARVCNN
jgi:putative hydrolase of the HAD superfamily